MINIRPINNAAIYTYGSWTSQILINSKSGMPTGVTSEWGELHWDEENTGTGYTGMVRIDILRSYDDTVLLADIALNSDGTATDLSGQTFALQDIRIRVKLYGADYPTPKVSNIFIKYKNWIGKQLITNNGKNVILTKFVSSSSTPITNLRLGNGQTSDFTDKTTALANNIYGPVATTNETNTDYNTQTSTYALIGQTALNGTIMNSVGVENTDASEYFCGAIRFSDITIDQTNYNYNFRIKYRIFQGSSTKTLLTPEGKNTMMDRIFKSSPTYNALSNYAVGTLGTLSSASTALDTSIYGPVAASTLTLDTASNKLSFIGTLDQSTGNGSTVNAISNTSSTDNRVLCLMKTESNILKTSTYSYLFISSYNLKTPTDYLLV